MKTRNTFTKTLFISLLTMLQTTVFAGSDNTLNASFAYIFSWTNTYEILLINTSSGSYNQIEWDMGDGTIYNFNQSQHIYQQDGIYEITLSISNSQSGESSSMSLEVSVPNTGCNNTFSYQATGQPNEFEFSGVFPYAPPPANLTFEWDFGDGTTATGMNILHTFPETGVDYTVTLTTTTWQGSYTCSFTSSRVVNSGTQADCFAEFTYEVASPDGMTIQFNDASFTSSGNPPSSVTWEFGDYASSSELNPSHTYYDNGTYQVIYTIYDSITGCSDVYAEEIVIDGDPPLRANFFYFFTNFYEILLIDNTTGNISEYLWDMGDGTLINEPISQYEYSEDGDYIITLLVTDGETGEQTSYSMPISLPNSGCNTYFYYESTGNSHEFEFNAYTPYYIQPYYEGFIWDFGDGNTGEGRDIIHAFDSTMSDQFIVTLTRWTTDYFGEDTCFFSISDTVFIDLIAGGDMVQDPTNPLTVHFTDQSTGDPTGWLWEFGDGNMSMAKNPTHTYNEGGVYDVCLHIFRNNMPPDSICMEFEVTTVGVNEIREITLSDNIFPNPNNGRFQFNVSTEKPVNTEVSVLNASGMELYMENRTVNGFETWQINLQDQLPKGLYLLVLKSENGQVTTRKFVLE